jgi:hypothetical protein
MRMRDALERDVDLRGSGSTRFRSEARARGLEPDECYKLGPLHEGDVPDIAIEVMVSRAPFRRARRQSHGSGPGYQAALRAATSR